ncbi:MAG TPA: hypothetical protein VEJ47_14540 [Candidatus Eremiobacteraceae bacterium]|nr:hypothetical protein [Candidatus Eremiobacteraceae bacterium]
MRAIKPLNITIVQFRSMDSFSGYVGLHNESRTSRGVHRHGRQASCKSPTDLAGTDAALQLPAGEGAHSAVALPAGREPDAVLAEPTSRDAGCASSMNESSRGKVRRGKKSTGDGDGPTNYLAQQRAQIPGGDVLPEDGAGFVERVNDRIDLIRLTENVLRGEDDKNVKSLLGQLLTVCYKNARRPAPKKQDGPDKLTWNLPR